MRLSPAGRRAGLGGQPGSRPPFVSVPPFLRVDVVPFPPPPPTAVVASNDWTAIGALHAIDAAGLRVPEDISLVGFDDIPLVSYTNPALTSVRMSAADVGATAFNALFSLIGGDRLEGDTYQVATKLIVRESTAKPARR